MPLQPQQTRTPYHISGRADEQALVDEFKGKPLTALRTPALIIDRAIFARNCAQMHERAKCWGASFRAHVKSHKTAEGTRLQLSSSADTTHAIVVSTIMEACEVLRAGLLVDGMVNDILYGLPLALNKVADLSALWDQCTPFNCHFRVLIDHPEQIRFVEAWEQQRGSKRRWSVFIKVDCGLKRAGLQPADPIFEELLHKALTSTFICVYGFYTHGGHSYSATSLPSATAFLSKELDAVNTAAGRALQILASSPDAQAHESPFVLAIGSTPTAHAVTPEAREFLSSLNGRLEIHAGNYPLLDLQMLHTGLVGAGSVAQRVLATIISYYPGRGEDGTDEAMCDAGAIAMSKETGPIEGYGMVVDKPWRLSRISQEHGILTQTRLFTREEMEGKEGKGPRLKIGDNVSIFCQHACLTLANFPWYYVVDSDGPDGAKNVCSVWVPWKGW
ncbi:hypothetical protein CERSUDRAFT_110623 [Gelatoporia subvermispora B]|uniref:D-serine dehydratase n=1 Tax=Ceriporiopsis subvermispora (strain B) TaxID=914234 RepID=M2RUE4_CERS8|nr:hypothetical protein CERSUDRAFT_110623 [Gelatoporia subvermispora B]